LAKFGGFFPSLKQRKKSSPSGLSSASSMPGHHVTICKLFYLTLSSDLLWDHPTLGAEDLGGGGVVREAGESRQVLNAPVRIYL
jgi:hypothetical protein